MQRKVSIVVLQEPSGPEGQETLWVIPDEDDPGKDTVPVAYEHPHAVQILEAADQARVQYAADQLSVLFERLGFAVTQAAFPGD